MVNVTRANSVPDDVQRRPTWTPAFAGPPLKNLMAVTEPSDLGTKRIPSSTLLVSGSIATVGFAVSRTETPLTVVEGMGEGAGAATSDRRVSPGWAGAAGGAADSMAGSATVPIGDPMLTVLVGWSPLRPATRTR